MPIWFNAFLYNILRDKSIMEFSIVQEKVQKFVKVL